MIYRCKVLGRSKQRFNRAQGKPASRDYPLGEELVHVYLAHRRTIRGTPVLLHGSTRDDIHFFLVQFQTDRTSGLAVRKVNLQLLGTGRAYVFSDISRTHHFF